MSRTTIKLALISSCLAVVAALAPQTPAGAAEPVPGKVMSATATAQRIPASFGLAAGWRFTWGTLTAGDCTMFQGASWTVYDNGLADFDGTVTSSDNNDAWLMWADLKDANGAVLTRLHNRDIQNPADFTEFIQNLPDHTQTYRWFAHGDYNSYYYQYLRGMQLYYSC